VFISSQMTACESQQQWHDAGLRERVSEISRPGSLTILESGGHRTLLWRRRQMCDERMEFSWYYGRPMCQSGPQQTLSHWPPEIVF